MLRTGHSRLHSEVVFIGLRQHSVVCTVWTHVTQSQQIRDRVPTSGLRGFLMIYGTQRVLFVEPSLIIMWRGLKSDYDFFATHTGLHTHTHRQRDICTVRLIKNNIFLANRHDVRVRLDTGRGKSDRIWCGHRTWIQDARSLQVWMWLINDSRF